MDLVEVEQLNRWSLVTKHIIGMPGWVNELTSDEQY